MIERCVGLDFGTTNSALAEAHPGGGTTLAAFGDATTWRSVVFFDEDAPDALGRPSPFSGPEAVSRYLGGNGGRFLQSLKSWLASELFKQTTVGNRQYTLEQLVAVVLRELRQSAEATMGPLGRRVVCGRPIAFAQDKGESTESASAAGEALALTRLERALEWAGFDEVEYEYEPVAAAYHYEQRLDHDELVLIADFGGGTSDFTLCEVGPSRRSRATSILRSAGLPMAGDALDACIVEAEIGPELGSGSSYRAFVSGKIQPLPRWIFSKLRRWHHLAFLRSKDNMEALERLHFLALEPERLGALIHIVEENLGFHLYAAVEAAKCELSSAEQGQFRFDWPPVTIERVLERSAFDQQISVPLTRIQAVVSRLLSETGIGVGDVDRVFMTGGTSRVPAVRKIFASTFGANKLEGGEDLTTVARGLALRALES